MLAEGVRSKVVVGKVQSSYCKLSHHHINTLCNLYPIIIYSIAILPYGLALTNPIAFAGLFITLQYLCPSTLCFFCCLIP